VDSIRLVAVAPQPTAVTALTSDWEHFPSLWLVLLGEVWESMRAAGASAGRNVMLYKDARPAVEVGAELLGPYVPDGRIVVSSLPAGSAVTTVAEGRPTANLLALAHQRVAEWCSAHGHEALGPRWEVYSHWSEDPTAMSTEVYWLVS
jgi:hypothetical protein